MQQTRGLGRSDIGRKRQQNEDAFLVEDSLGLYVVSDGMGGHAAGEIAATMAIEAVEDVVRDHELLLEKVANRDEPRSRLVEVVEKAVVEASQRVFAAATAPDGPAGMGCTLTVLLVAGPAAVMAHVGDSRLYRVRNGEVSQLSMDHTVLNEMLRAGLLDDDEAERSPYKNVLSRAVGIHAAVRVDTLVLEALPGDRYLLCSDGFSNYLDDPDSLAERLEGELAEIADALVASANEGGGRDNITVVVVDVSSDEEQTERITRVERNVDALGSVFLFEDADAPFLAHMLGACRSQRHKAGEVVVAEGAVCDSLFVVVKGSYELVVDDEVTGRFAAGSYTGVHFLLDPRPARATLRAAEPSRLLRLTSARFSQAIRERPWFGIALLEQLGRRLSRDLDSAIQAGEVGEAASRGEHL